MEMIKGYINSVETFGSVDGPGIRYIVFLQGCGMRCQYCHNPNTWNITKSNGKTADDVLKDAIQYRPYWGDKGGITASGGEALLQIDFLIDLFQKAKALGVNTTLDTCGQPYTTKEPFYSKFKQLMEVTDLVILDIKHIDTVKHKALTGWGNENILDLARYLSDHGKPMWIRHVLVPERTDYDEDLTRLGEFIRTLNHVDKVEILPYHVLGVLKYKELNLPYPLEGINPPTKDRIENAERLLHTEAYKGYLTRKFSA